MAQMVKNLPALQETWVRSLGWEDPLEDWYDGPFFGAGLIMLFSLKSAPHIEQADWKSYGSIFQKKCLGFSQ